MYNKCGKLNNIEVIYIKVTLIIIIPPLCVQRLYVHHLTQRKWAVSFEVTWAFFWSGHRDNSSTGSWNVEMLYACSYRLDGFSFCHSHLLSKENEKTKQTSKKKIPLVLQNFGISIFSSESFGNRNQISSELDKAVLNNLYSCT